ncbi:MAG TPA: glycoside hydrolase family 97 protein [Rhodothermales bacterium]|nr:glycoside hydrolase family 97 protein [Rhodothermales bacterium]
MPKPILLALLLFFFTMQAFAQTARTYHVKSPDGRLELTLDAGADLKWSVTHDGAPVITPSVIALTLDSGEVLGVNPAVSDTEAVSVDAVITPAVYKKTTIQDRYNQLTVTMEDGYGVVLRAYDDGAAYRLFLDRAGDLTVRSEAVHYNFAGDYTAHVPFIRDLRNHDVYMSASEAHYDVQPLSAIEADTMAYSPLLVELPGSKKAVILEADLEAYPGMFLRVNPETHRGFQGVFAPYPLREEQKGISTLVPEREDVIAHVSGTRTLPWRAVAVSSHDYELLNSDLVYKLASPSRVEDTSWIEPGKVAWDWWNDWNLRGVDFRSGVNMPTYEFYVDFAADNGLEYIIMDAGWSKPGDLTQSIPEIDLPELISYAREKGVGIILWAAWHEVRGHEDTIFPLYADMGIKGFKIDFFDRDDQAAVESVYHIAERAAAYKLVLDLHGMYKPTGLQRTYPNVLNIEGVKGMENVKWTPVDDVPRYDVNVPYIRMLVGPMDYTPGAMRNATRHDFRPSNSTPMSHGTRTHQLAMYTVFEAPLQMLADSPTNYMDEQESTDFIASVPTVFDETVALDGEVGEYVALARRKGDTWYVGAMTNWTPRDLTIDLSFLGPGPYEAVIFQDGVNADRDARDYKRVVRRVTASDKLNVHMSEGGGWTARIYPAK